jgi:hypothetical protein
MSPEKNLKGLGGWLILVGLGVVLSPIAQFFNISVNFIPLFVDGTWEILTTPGEELYNPMWASILIGELVYNAASLLVAVYLVYLFFSKHYLFPFLFIVTRVIALIFIPLDAWLVSFVLPDEPMFDPETARTLSRTVSSVLIWVPYMLVSKRVKATFTEKSPYKPSTLDSAP